MTHVTIRRAVSSDQADLHRLAELDGTNAPHGDALVSEADSRLVAALPLGAGRPIADPFVPTAEIVALLQTRAAQLNPRATKTRRAVRWLRSLIRRPAGP